MWRHRFPHAIKHMHVCVWVRFSRPSCQTDENFSLCAHVCMQYTQTASGVVSGFIYILFIHPTSTVVFWVSNSNKDPHWSNYFGCVDRSLKIEFSLKTPDYRLALVKVMYVRCVYMCMFLCSWYEPANAVDIGCVSLKCVFFLPAC